MSHSALLDDCFFPLKIYLLFYAFECFAYVYTCAPGVCVVPAEVRRGSQMLWGSNYVWLKAIIWVLGVELGPSGRAINARNYGV